MADPIVSVVIPTFNGSDRVGDVLDALALQELPASQFEVLVIDNASTDGTDRMVEARDSVAALRAREGSVRVVPQPLKGLTYARISGALNAKGKFLCFLDDDNIPAPDYLQNGVARFTSERVGVLISRIAPKFESPPSAAILKRDHLLAVNDDFGDQVACWPAGNTFAPTLGAGMWVRLDIFLQVIPCDHPEQLFADRQGSSLRCGGDIELGMLIGRAGYDRVYAPDLRLQHLIGSQRLTRAYINRLITAIIRSQASLDERYLGIRNTPAKWLRSLAELILRIVVSPLLLIKPDGVNEACFVIVAALAKLAGPYPD